MTYLLCVYFIINTLYESILIDNFVSSVYWYITIQQFV